MSEPAAPAAEAAGLDVTAGLVILASLIVSVGLRLLYLTTLGLLLTTLAEALNFSVLGHRVHLGGKLEALNNTILHSIGGWIVANEHAFALWLHANEKVFTWMFDGLSWFAWAAHDFGTNLVNHTIPSYVHSLTHGLKTTVTHTTHTVTHVTRVVTKEIVQVRKANAAAIENTFGRAWHGIDYIEKIALPRLWHGVHALDAEVVGLGRWAHRVLTRRLSRLEKLVLGTALTGTVLAVLTRYFPYWRCTNVRRFMRGLCRSPLGSLDWLFGLAAIGLVALDIEEIYHAAADLTDELGGLFERIES